MTAMLAPNERCRDVLAAASALETLTQTLSVCCSNFADMDPREEASFCELWVRLADLQKTLEERCHGLPPSAGAKLGRSASYCHGSVSEGEVTQWHKARTTTPPRVTEFHGRLADGTDCGSFTLTADMETTCVCVADGTPIGHYGSDKSGIPECILPVAETRRILGYSLISDSRRTGWRGTADGHYSMPEFGVEKALGVFAADDGLRPDVVKGTLVLADERITVYTGKGCYLVRTGNGRASKLEIAIIQALDDGSFLYTADKSKPVTFPDLRAVTIVGKAFLFLTQADNGSDF